MDGLISVVVATYNRPDALDAVLRALSRQSDNAFEVIVADDGSGPETAAVIDAWRDRLTVPLIHSWQPDAGFRIARARNRAVVAGSGGYIVLLDGDCVPQPDFVAQHRRLAERGYVVFGSRVLLSRSLTRAVLAAGEPIETWRLRRWLVERARRRINRCRPLIRLPGQRWRRRRWSSYLSLRSANFALWRDDYLAVDGFDERFEGWGYEDTDLAIRLHRGGVERKDGRYATAVLHLWHPEADRSAIQANGHLLAETSATARVRAVVGVSSHQPS